MKKLLILALLPLTGFACFGMAVEKEDTTRDEYASTILKIPKKPAVVEDEPIVNANVNTAPSASVFVQQNFEELTSDHFTGSSPANNSLHSEAPKSIAINFSLGLTEDSTLTITRDGEVVPVGASVITNDDLQILTGFTSEERGNYLVEYSACFLDGSCEEGSFGFTVAAGAVEEPGEETSEPADGEVKDLPENPEEGEPPADQPAE